MKKANLYTVALLKSIFFGGLVISPSLVAGHDCPQVWTITFEVEADEFSTIESYFDKGACAPAYTEEVEIEMEFDNDDESLASEIVGEADLEAISGYYFKRIPSVVLVCAGVGVDFETQAEEVFQSYILKGRPTTRKSKLRELCRKWKTWRWVCHKGNCTCVPKDLGIT